MFTYIACRVELKRNQNRQLANLLQHHTILYICNRTIINNFTKNYLSGNSSSNFAISLTVEFLLTSKFRSPSLEQGSKSISKVLSLDREINDCY